MMKNNRRNHYRLLQLQPDASLDIIKNNYRTLLHKLRLHPDLGGGNLTASYINLAYATLRNSVKRAAYDQRLFNQYKIEDLSKGHLSPKRTKVNVTADNNYSKNNNRRHYYRILHIQPDAAQAIISSSYKILIKQQIISIELVKEAFSVLGTPLKRKHYDQMLKENRHVNSISKNSSARNKKKIQGDQADCKLESKVTKLSSSHQKNSLYQSLTTYYCLFCKTPQSHSPMKFVDELCIECQSPLHSAQKNISLPRRFFSRIDLTSTLGFYKNWPGIETFATLSDLSPTGLCFETRLVLKESEIIKINADQFQAIGEVKHIQPTASFFIVGVQFLTIQFNTQKGTFMSTSV